MSKVLKYYRDRKNNRDKTYYNVDINTVIYGFYVEEQTMIDSYDE